MLLEIAGLSVNYGGVAALGDVSLAVREGSIVAILGANGAGKSTLLGAIMGDVEGRVTGSIRLSGDELTGRRTEQIVSAGVALAPEGRQLFPDLTVDENLMMGAYLRRDRTAIAEDLAKVRVLFPRLAERRSQIAATLSGGEQQMVAIGRALMSRPRLLLLDEPSLGLAPLLVGEIMRLVTAIHRSGVTVLLVEQNARQALRIADHAYIIEKGRITMAGEARQLAHNPHVTAAYLGGA